VTLEEVVVLSFDNAGEFDLDPFDLVKDDYGACQEFGERCRQDPGLPKAIQVPSAALPGTENLVIFQPKVRVAYDLDPVDDVDVPATVVAEDARPLHTLLPLVRLRGMTHKAYASWQRGTPYVFLEPPSPLLR
jgi:hypothetical protein